MKETDERVLRIEIPSLFAEKAAEEPEWTDTVYSNGWSIVPGGLYATWSGTIDLSGYAREMKTFYPSAALIQRGTYCASAGGDGLIDYTIVSTIPLNLDEVIISVLGLGGPGFLNWQGISYGQNWETVMFAESRLYVPNSNITPNTFGIMNLLENNQSGSLEATATDTLYVVRFVLPFGSTLTTLNVPSSRVIIPGKFGMEPDVEYMMRLKRSTELSQQV